LKERERMAVESNNKLGRRAGGRRSATTLPQKKKGQPRGWP
jgi:hypothetical protein